MARVEVRLPWGRRRFVPWQEIVVYALVLGWVLFVLISNWATKEAGDGWSIVALRIVGGTAGTFVAFLTGWLLFLYQRRWVTKRRILDSVGSGTDRMNGQDELLLDQLVAQLASRHAVAHLVVNADGSADRLAATIGLSRALARRGMVPVWVTGADSKGGFEAKARESFLFLADRVGEHGDNIGRLWSTLWAHADVVVVATGIDDGQVPGDPMGMTVVRERLADLSGLPVPTVAFVMQGLTGEPTEIDAAFDHGSMDVAPPELPRDDAALAAMTHVGRVLHLRNDRTWLWEDVPADADDGLLTAGMSLLIAAGSVVPTRERAFAFSDARLLAQARGLGAGMGGSAHWSTVLALPHSQVILTSLEDAAAAAFIAPEDQHPVQSLATAADIGDLAAEDMSVFGAIYSGVRRQCGAQRATTGEGVALLPSWRFGHRDESDPIRLAVLRQLGISEDPRLIAWAWHALRDAALPASSLSYPVCRALITELAEEANGAIGTLGPAWHADVEYLRDFTRQTSMALLQPPAADGRRSRAWPEVIGMACHLAWLLPLMYARADRHHRELVRDHMCVLRDIALATTEVATTEESASTDFLQAWAEGVYYGVASLQDSSESDALTEFFMTLTDYPQPWPARLALSMAQTAAGGTAPMPRDDDHPIVRAMLGQLAAATTLTGDARSRVLARIMWREEFAELRSAGRHLSPQVRWILAAKAVLFSAGEARRGEKGAHNAAGVRERRLMMTGQPDLPTWVATSHLEHGRDRVTVEQIKDRPDRHVSRTFARLVLEGEQPILVGSRLTRHDDHRFWGVIHGILEAIRDAPRGPEA